MEICEIFLRWTIRTKRASIKLFAYSFFPIFLFLLTPLKFRPNLFSKFTTVDITSKADTQTHSNFQKSNIKSNHNNSRIGSRSGNYLIK